MGTAPAGLELFVYQDEEGAVVDVDSSDVNDHLRELTGEDVTSKDFPHLGWHGPGCPGPRPRGRPGERGEAGHNIRRAIDAAADRLNDTRAVARGSYVHPRIPDAYRDGELLDRWKRARRRSDLDRPERLVLSLLTAR